ncbi:PAAR domain-containing protein [Persephonella sp.]
MGKPAARLGDQTAHGAPLSPGPGSPDVLIGGKPAWRLTDILSCPVSTPNPHGTGVVINPSKTVFINGIPAVRMGDVIQEAGPSNTVITGEMTVLIGD